MNPIINVARVLIVSLALIVTTNATAIPITIQIDAYIDGTSFLKIHGDTVWWEHETFSAPGEWEHGAEPPPLPTIVNGNEWYPDWSGLDPYRNPFLPCVDTAIYTCSSDSVSGLLPALAPIEQTIQIEFLNVRNSVSVTNPDALNDFTASIYFDDYYVGGAAWYSIALTYESLGVSVPEPQTAVLFLTLLFLVGFSITKRKSGQ